MKNLTRFLVCAGVSLCAFPSHANSGPYPGLDFLIESADTIAIVGVEYSPTIGGIPIPIINNEIRSDCTVYQTLKGDLKTGTRLPVLLNNAAALRPIINGDLASMSTHLVFLRRYKDPINGVGYAVLRQKGADLPLSPIGIETKAAEKTLKAQIQTLIQRYKTYRDEQRKREDAILDKALAE